MSRLPRVLVLSALLPLVVASPATASGVRV
jgi:hypothetical protein